MTPRERILSVYRNEMPDQLPVGIYARYLARGAWERECRQLGLALIDFIPPVSLLAPPWHALPGYVSEVIGASFRIEHEWRDGHPLTRHVYRTPLGEISRETVIDAETGSEWITDHYIQESEDYERMQYVIENTVFRKRYDEFVQRDRDLGGDGILLGRIDRSGYQKLIVELAEPQRAMVDMRIDPALAEGLIDAINERVREQFTMALESPADVVWQPENLTADMTPPDLFERYCLPLYREFAERCRDRGKVYLVHMDGRLGPLRDLIARAEVPVVESFSLPEMANDMTPADALHSWSGSVVCPNFPATLCEESDEGIQARLTRLVEEMGPRTPFMLQVSEDLPTADYMRVMLALSSFSSSCPLAAGRFS